MIIPASLRLMGHTVTIDLVPPIQWKRKDCIGFFDPQAMRIVIRRGRKTVVEQAYFHELMHAIFYCLGFDELYGDEQKVDSIAGLLHQAATTQKHPRQNRRSRKG